MPRANTADFLMTHKFHLLDVSLSIPAVLTPVFGFSSITAPELNIEYKEIKEGNYEYPRKVFNKATVNDIIIANGVTLQDNDFFSWASNYLAGKREKKTLMLVQFINLRPATKDRLGKIPIGQPSAIEFTANVPGRAWILRNCSPSRYKAASDFDASNAGVSIKELGISYEEFAEFNTGVLK